MSDSNVFPSLIIDSAGSLTSSQALVVRDFELRLASFFPFAVGEEEEEAEVEDFVADIVDVDVDDDDDGGFVLLFLESATKYCW